MYVAVVERVSQWNFRVESIVPPQTKADMEKFLSNGPTGNWVACGQCYTKAEVVEALKKLGVHKEPEMVAPEDAAEARADTFKHPERKGWVEQGKKVMKSYDEVVKDPSKMVAFAKLFAGIAAETDFDAAQKASTHRRSTHDGKGEVVFWNSAARLRQMIEEAGIDPDAGK
jgi:hypothetical protein